jgi:hypothetical protein
MAKKANNADSAVKEGKNTIPQQNGATTPPFRKKTFIHRAEQIRYVRASHKIFAQVALAVTKRLVVQEGSCPLQGFSDSPRF